MSTKRGKDVRIAAERFLHCWADGPEETVLLDSETEKGFEGPWWGRLRLIGSTCMLPDGHEGEHEFTPDGQITIQFAGGEEGIGVIRDKKEAGQSES